jgi:hypothetical protein
MVAHKRLYLIVIALCLWLPLQAIAGQWLHCAQLESSLTQLDAIPAATPHSSCHDVPTDVPTKAPLDQSTLTDQASTLVDINSCKHCQFSCSWHSALVLREFMQPRVDSSIIYTQFILPSPVLPLLATPQRPPRFHT